MIIFQLVHFEFLAISLIVPLIDSKKVFLPAVSYFPESWMKNEGARSQEKKRGKSEDDGTPSVDER